MSGVRYWTKDRSSARCKRQVRVNSEKELLNILQIISGREVNGALVYCKLLAEQLVRRGHRVTVLCRPDSWMSAQDASPGVVRMESEMYRIPPTELRKFARWVRANNVDLIHTHMSRGHTFGILLRLMTGVPVIATAHSRHFQLHWKLNNFVIANSRATRDYQRRVNRVLEDKIATIHCYSDLSKFNEVTRRSVRIVQRQLRLTGDEFLIGVVGEVIPRKGQLYLFRALERLVREIPNLKLVLLGRFRRDEIYVQRLRSILLKQGLFRRVKWLGRRGNIADFMTAFDLCVVPSVEEPLGLVAIEALAAGTPVVATDTGGLPEIVRHEQTGLLVPSRDPLQLGDAIIRMARDPELCAKLGGNGQKMVAARFDPDRLTDQVVDIYQQVLKQRTRSAA